MGLLEDVSTALLIPRAPALVTDTDAWLAMTVESNGVPYRASDSE